MKTYLYIVFVSLLTALLLYTTGCQSSEQLTYIQSKRIKYATAALNRPIVEGTNVKADNLKVYGQAPELDPMVDPLKEWLDAGVDVLKTAGMFWLGGKIVKKLSKDPKAPPRAVSTKAGGE